VSVEQLIFVILAILASEFILPYGQMTIQVGQKYDWEDIDQGDILSSVFIYSFPEIAVKIFAYAIAIIGLFFERRGEEGIWIALFIFIGAYNTFIGWEGKMDEHLKRTRSE